MYTAQLRADVPAALEIKAIIKGVTTLFRFIADEIAVGDSSNAGVGYFLNHIKSNVIRSTRDQRLSLDKAYKAIKQ